MAFGLPSFSHLDFTAGDTAKWHEYMDPKARTLAHHLYQTRSSWGMCIICEVDFPNSLETHICGKNHMKKLHQKLQYRYPQDPVHLSTLTQYWELEANKAPRRYYYFNHLTGDQDYADEKPDPPSVIEHPPGLIETMSQSVYKGKASPASPSAPVNNLPVLRHR